VFRLAVVWMAIGLVGTTASALPANVSFASDNSGPSFFERLFGGPSVAPAPAPSRRLQQRRVFTR